MKTVGSVNQWCNDASFSCFRLVWVLQEKMFALRLYRWLQPEIHTQAPSRVQNVHKLASLQKIMDLPSKKVQSLLYPFTELETYLDRYSVGHMFVLCVFTGWVRCFSWFWYCRSVDKTQFQLFHPSVEDMVNTEKLFCSSSSHRIDYYVSAERMDHVPALKQPEVSEISNLLVVSLTDIVRRMFAIL